MHRLGFTIAFNVAELAVIDVAGVVVVVGWPLILNKPWVVDLEVSDNGSIFSTQLTEPGPVTVQVYAPSFSVLSSMSVKVPSLPPWREMDILTLPEMLWVSHVMAMVFPVSHTEPCAGSEMIK